MIKIRTAVVMSALFGPPFCQCRDLHLHHGLFSGRTRVERHVTGTWCPTGGLQVHRKEYSRMTMKIQKLVLDVIALLEGFFFILSLSKQVFRFSLSMLMFGVHS